MFTCILLIIISCSTRGCVSPVKFMVPSSMMKAWTDGKEGWAGGSHWTESIWGILEAKRRERVRQVGFRFCFSQIIFLQEPSPFHQTQGFLYWSPQCLVRYITEAIRHFNHCLLNITPGTCEEEATKTLRKIYQTEQRTLKNWRHDVTMRSHSLLLNLIKLNSFDATIA